MSGESFLTPPGPLSEMLGKVVKDVTGLTPELSTTGGTSDARYFKNYCPVAEFGLTNRTAHKVNERVKVEDILTLTKVYAAFLRAYFA